MRLLLATLLMASCLTAQFNPRAAPGHSPDAVFSYCCESTRKQPILELRQVEGFRARVGQRYAIRMSRNSWPRCDQFTQWAAYYSFGTRLPYPQPYPWPYCNGRPFASMSDSPLMYAWISPLFSRRVDALPGGDLTAYIFIPATPSLMGVELWIQGGVDRWGTIPGPTPYAYWNGRMHTWAATVRVR